ncbi:NAD(P)-dependent oxidoreductase [Streptomyces sp. NPDC004752]
MALHTGQSIGWIGTGVMGAPMVRNLLAAGFEVTVFNRTRSKLQPLIEAGALPADDIAELSAKSDIVCTMLSDSESVREVVEGDAGVARSLRPNSLFVDFSTIHPSMSRRIARTISRGASAALDAPVSGGEIGAINGALSIMVGGEDRGFASAQAVFAAVGSRATHVGPAGSGQLVKAANQILVGGTIGLLSEALILLEHNNVSTAQALDALAGGLAGSRVLDLKGPAMVKESFDPGFRIALHDKDMQIALESLQEAHISATLTATTAQLFADAVGAGDGQLDHAAIIRTVRRSAVPEKTANPADGAGESIEGRQSTWSRS